MRIVVLALSIVGCSNNNAANCPLVPIHCACATDNPACVNGQWTCPSPSGCGGMPCTMDAECGAGAYCKSPLNVCNSDCQLTIGTAATGTCHRSCVGGGCACADDTDCPGFYTSCDVPTQTCKSLSPPVCHASCPAGCADGTRTQYGEVCVCAACP